jgi:hypothetical protein
MLKFNTSLDKGVLKFTHPTDSFRTLDWSFIRPYALYPMSLSVIIVEPEAVRCRNLALCSETGNKQIQLSNQKSDKHCPSYCGTR